MKHEIGNNNNKGLLKAQSNICKRNSDKYKKIILNFYEKQLAVNNRSLITV